MKLSLSQEDVKIFCICCQRKICHGIIINMVLQKISNNKNSNNNNNTLTN